jgi:hypothetical protein
LLVTDRLAVRIYVITSGRTITLHTEDGNLCEVLTTFSTGLNALNGLTSQVQYFATGTSGTDFAISSATDTHTFNLPTASATNRGALSSADWSAFSGKVGGSGAAGQIAYWNGTSSQTGSAGLTYNNTSGIITLTNTTGGSTTPSLVFSTSSFNSQIIIGNSTYGFAAGANSLNFWHTVNGPIAFFNGGSTPTRRFSILGDGRVVVGDATTASRVFEVKATGNGDGITIVGTNANTSLAFNHTATGGTATWGFNSAATGSSQTAGTLALGSASANNILFFPTGNVVLGASNSSDAGFKLDVNGTARVSDNLTVSKNQNAVTSLQISNTNSGSGSQVSFQLFSDSLSGGSSLSKVSSTATTYKVITASDSSFYNSTAGDITFLNDATSGKLKFAMGGASTAQMTLTAAGRLLLGTTTEGTNLLDVNGGVNITGNATIVGNLTVDTNTLFVDAANNRVGVGNITPLSNIDVRQSSTNKNGIWITGAEYVNPVNSDASNGIAIILGINRSANRQVWIGSSEVIGSATLGLIRLQTGTNIPSIDGVTGNGSTRLNLNIGSATSNVLIGQPDGNTTLPASSLSVARNFSVGASYFGIAAPTNGAMIEGNVLIGSTTNNSSALLNVTSTTQGFLPPRMTTTQKNAIGTPAAGLVVYDTDTNKLCCYNGTSWNDLF